jgi:hypothetical protein
MSRTPLHRGHELSRRAVSRRTFPAADGLSFCGLGLSALARPAPARARSTILIWLSGGMSHDLDGAPPGRPLLLTLLRG